jgi:hypothetical protein
MRAGQALRGSSEFHAWGDSNLYLRRHGDQLTLSVEHRAAAAITAITLQLAVNGDAVALEAVERNVSERPVAAEDTVARRIEAHLAAAATPLTATSLRKLCKVRNADLSTALAALVAEGTVRKDGTRYEISR